MAKVSLTDFFSDKEFLKAKDLRKNSISLTIASVETVKLSRTQLVLRFKEMEKSFGLSKADLKFMLNAHGDETDKWIGKKITLGKMPSTTPRGQDTVTLHLVN